jgi:hypothetical protein
MSEPTIYQRAKDLIVSSFRRIAGIDLPDDGRSSVENASGLGLLGAGAFGTVIPPFNLDLLRTLKELWMCNPDLSQHVTNLKSVGNTGHQITVDAATDQKAEAALARLNEASSRLYANGAGVDGLINAYLAQIAVFGALSSEDVVDFGARRVDQVVIVPVEQVRFRYLDGRYVPHQQPGALFGLAQSSGQSPLGLRLLSPTTYRYFAIQTVENSPYALPPMCAAVDILRGPQKDAIDNIKWIVKKLGILGLVAVLLKKPGTKSQETDQEYKKRLESFLETQRKTLDGNFNKGLLVGYKGEHDVTHSNVASDARGSDAIFQVIEELGFSGMGSMAAFHGRNYTTTETFADVIWYFLLAQSWNMQRLAKRRQEQTYRLDLALAGIEVDGLSLAFNKSHSRNQLQEAQADETVVRTVLAKAKAGIISPDDAAQELGYESAFDPEMLSAQPAVAGALSARRLSGLTRAGVTATFRFDRTSQRYRFAGSPIVLASDPVETEDSRVLPFEKKMAA